MRVVIKKIDDEHMIGELLIFPYIKKIWDGDAPTITNWAKQQVLDHGFVLRRHTYVQGSLKFFFLFKRLRLYNVDFKEITLDDPWR